MLYIVKFSSGDYDDWAEYNLFVTNKKSTATKYVTKFNRILKKWKEYYKQYESDELGMSWIKDEYVESYFNRWYGLRRINKCYWCEIEER